MKTLRLPLKKEWFEMTKAGIKTEEYRGINEYWAKRFVGSWTYKGDNKGLLPNIKNSYMSGFYPNYFQKFDTTTLTLGYPSNSDKDRIIELEQLSISIGYGKEEWGAEPNKLYFVIKHGKRIN